MVINMIFLLFFLGHILGDFYFQTSKMAKQKEKSYGVVLKHCLYYFLVNLGVLFAIVDFKVDYQLYIWGFLISIAHFIVDTVKYGVEYKYRKTEKEKDKEHNLQFKKNIFLTDQLFHFICIIVFSYLAGQEITQVPMWHYVNVFAQERSVSIIAILKVAVGVLLMAKPANIFVQKITAMYKPNTNEENTIKNTGRFIGLLERFIMLVFMWLGQYGALGLVLTAKSIARYEKISKDPAFAEYYLLGTLLSTLIVIVSALALQWL